MRASLHCEPPLRLPRTSEPPPRSRSRRVILAVPVGTPAALGSWPMPRSLRSIPAACLASAAPASALAARRCALPAHSPVGVPPCLCFSSAPFSAHVATGTPRPTASAARSRNESAACLALFLVDATPPPATSAMPSAILPSMPSPASTSLVPRQSRRPAGGAAKTPL